jgi:Domain of unknown function (DUF1906)
MAPVGRPMTVLEGVDYSYGRAGGAALAAAGKRFAVRYVSTAIAGGYLTAAEAADLHAHGIGVAFVFEGAATGALAGAGQGNADGATAKAALALLGVPADRPIYFAVDFDASDAQLVAVDAYLRGAAGPLGAARVGVYGGIRTIRHCQAAGSARWYWQTYAWSAGQIAPGIHLLQYSNGQVINGASVDFDRSYPDDFGQWGGDMIDPTKDLGAYEAHIAPAVVYADRAGTTKLIDSWAGGPAGVYSRAAPTTSVPNMSHGPAAIRINMGTVTAPRLVIGWVDDSKVPYPAAPAAATGPTAADVAAAEAKGYAAAKQAAIAATEGI